MRRWTLAGVALALTLMAPAWAQQYSADKPMGATAQSTPAFLKKAGINQNLSQQLPLNDRFVDSSGTEVPLATYFQQRPVVMALVYYKCRMLCPQVLSGMAKTLREVALHAGQGLRRRRGQHRSRGYPSRRGGGKDTFSAVAGKAGRRPRACIS